MVLDTFTHLLVGIHIDPYLCVSNSVWYTCMCACMIACECTCVCRQWLVSGIFFISFSNLIYNVTSIDPSQT